MNQTTLSKEEIILRTKRKLFLHQHGEHESIFSGRGMDFREIREYSSDDDIRYLNWKITARVGKPYINTYNETKQIHIVAVYLNSGGISFGEPKPKSDTAREALVSLSYATVHNHDSLSTLFYSESRQQWYPPSRHRAVVDNNFDRASQIESIGEQIEFSNLSREILQKLKRKSIIFLIGDFWDFGSDVDLGGLADRHELYCIIIRDRAEETLSLRGRYQISDTSSYNSQLLDIDSATATRYATLVEEHDAMLTRHLAKHRISYTKIYTHDDTIDRLARLMRI